MCWADKITALWAFIIYFGLFAFSNDKSAALEWFFTWEGSKLLLILVLPIWAILRVIDWIAGGPAKRSGQIRAVQAIRD